MSTTPLAAACVFTEFDTATGQFKIKSNKPYYYLNPERLSIDSLALVHNGREFAIVRVISSFDPLVLPPSKQITKPLLGLFRSNPQVYLTAMATITGLTESIQLTAIHRNITKDLDDDKPKNSEDSDDDSFL